MKSYCYLSTATHQPESELDLFNKEDSSSSPPARSLPMMPEASFAISAKNKKPFCDYSPLGDDGLSALLTCWQCGVCVHASKEILSLEPMVGLQRGYDRLPRTLPGEITLIC